jgi:hypothetical protein
MSSLFPGPATRLRYHRFCLWFRLEPEPEPETEDQPEPEVESTVSKPQRGRHGKKATSCQFCRAVAWVLRIPLQTPAALLRQAQAQAQLHDWPSFHACHAGPEPEVESTVSKPQRGRHGKKANRAIEPEPEPVARLAFFPCLPRWGLDTVDSTSGSG